MSFVALTSFLSRAASFWASDFTELSPQKQELYLQLECWCTLEMSFHGYVQASLECADISVFQTLLSRALVS